MLTITRLGGVCNIVTAISQDSAQDNTVTTSKWLTVNEDRGQYRATARGKWTINNAADIDKSIRKLNPSSKQSTIIDFSELDHMDTTGAVLIRQLTNSFTSLGMVQRQGLTDVQEGLLSKVEHGFERAKCAPDEDHWFLKLVIDLGKHTEKVVEDFGRLLGFVGLVLIRSFKALLNPKTIRMTALVKQAELVGLNALGIVGLISFLIGAVMVNQGAIQLAKFNAEIYVVDMLGVGYLREMGVLIMAIIVAGRSGSSFTAQIGSMKLREEVDAMTTMGMNPIDVLVLPRLFALVLTMPLLAVYADIVGIAGGMMMAWVQLGIVPSNFVTYMQTAVSFDHYLVGILKAPAFAAVIAISGCYQGLRVHGSADSLGLCTTKSVVQSIFQVIILNAFFAVFFTAIGL